MATEAQVLANQRNAARSTGPRTRQGKEVVAQNALRHGLLATRNVVVGEEQQEFDLHRAGMLRELAPVGTMEMLFAERIVSLAWRLLRSERLQNQAFDYLLGQELERSTVRFPDFLTAKEEQEMCGSPKSDPGLAVGRMLVKDCGRDKVLDRLMLYERRIESSLRTAMKDLRDLRAERAANADGGTIEEIPAHWEPGPDSAEQSQSPTADGIPVPDPAKQSQCDAGDGGHSPSCEAEVSSGDSALETSNPTLHTPEEPPCCVTTKEDHSAEQSQIPDAAQIGVGGPTLPMPGYLTT